ncbi:MAG: DUF4126 family protein [Chloroflexi bacterium]|nr:DUF4126 family protein [Ktedonobacteraceae bacterium]MBV8822634.1 DUF4126 family protein [Ktedonobacteraceae bacterium]MBV9706944.1 DUF4126 family protein [Chloroflexota bacterium]
MKQLRLSDTSNPTNVYLRVAMLGFATGLRTMTPLSWLNSDGLLKATPGMESSPLLNTLQSPTIQTMIRLLAAGELFADKLPIIPSRTSLGPLGARLVIGGLAGMLLCRQYNQPPLAGAVVGGTSALISSYLASSLRKNLSKKARIPDFLLGMGEDMLVLRLGKLAMGKE